MTPYRKPPPRPQWPISLGYNGEPPIERGGVAARRFIGLVWTTLNLLVILVVAAAAFLWSLALAAGGAMLSAWIPMAERRGGTCVAAGVILAIALYPINVVILRWIYRPDRTRAPEQLALGMVMVIAVATIMGLAGSAAAHLR